MMSNFKYYVCKYYKFIIMSISIFKSMNPYKLTYLKNVGHKLHFYVKKSPWGEISVYPVVNSQVGD